MYFRFLGVPGHPKIVKFSGALRAPGTKACAQLIGLPMPCTTRNSLFFPALYLQEPHSNATGATAAELEYLLGGEASAWGDCISAESFEGMVWVGLGLCECVGMYGICVEIYGFCMEFH